MNWNHVALSSWAGIRGGISLAAALGIPLLVAHRPFPDRSAIIFITFAVILMTLVGQGLTLPFAIGVLRIKSDLADRDELRAAIGAATDAVLARLDSGDPATHAVPARAVAGIRQRYAARGARYAKRDGDTESIAAVPSRDLERDLIDLERRTVVSMRWSGAIDNRVMQRVIRMLDLPRLYVDSTEANDRTIGDGDGEGDADGEAAGERAR